MSLLRWLQRPIEVKAQAVRPGDMLFLNIADFPATQDPVRFLEALQAHFPRNAIHLLLGFGGRVEVAPSKRHPGGPECGGCSKQGCQEASVVIPPEATNHAKPAPRLAQRRVVVSSYLPPIVAFHSIPPEQVRDASEKGVGHV